MPEFLGRCAPGGIVPEAAADAPANFSFARSLNRCKPEGMIRFGFNFDSRDGSPALHALSRVGMRSKGEQKADRGQPGARHRFASTS